MEDFNHSIVAPEGGCAGYHTYNYDKGLKKFVYLSQRVVSEAVIRGLYGLEWVYYIPEPPYRDETCPFRYEFFK